MTDLKDLQSRLNNPPKIQKVDVKVQGYQVSQGQYTLPYIHLVIWEGKYFLVQNKVKDVKAVEFEDVCMEYFNGGYYLRLDKKVFDVMVEAVDERKKRKYLDNYTFLVGYCLGKGFDLEAMKLFN